MLMSAELKVCVMYFTYFLDVLKVRCVTDFREASLFVLPYP